MPQYQWLPLPIALENIEDRLNDDTFVSPAEAQIYLIEGLRIFNALTESFRTEFLFNTQGSQWQNLGLMTGSPRLRTVTDAQLATQMEYMLLEPPVGIGAWTGTTQFSVEKLQSSLQVRCNEVIQAGGTNTVNLPPINAVPSQRRYALTDTDLELRRIRFLQLIINTSCGFVSGSTTIAFVASAVGLVPGLVIQGDGIQAGTVIVAVIPGSPNSSLTISLPTIANHFPSFTNLSFFQPFYLKRSDTQAFHYFNSDYLQDVEVPLRWSVAAEPPLSFDVDTMPNTEGQYDTMVLQSGTQFSTTPTTLGLPDDWSWLPMYGALADLLSEEPESTDRQRAAYCAKRYSDGLEMLRKSNWFQQALINNTVVDTPSLEKKDRFSIGWQEDVGAIPAVVTDGIDQFNVSPCSPQVSVSLTVVQNAPFLDSTATFVQVTRDDWDQVLNYIQHIASFKTGGAEFVSTLPLLDEFLKYCIRKNRRQSTYGLYVDALNTAGMKQDVEQPRQLTATQPKGA